MKAPFPWFGGKRRVAPEVWGALGDVDNYVEPFAGSLAVLLERPHEGQRTMTVNDADGFVANFWRALHADPEQVARYADWPVNEVDLFARHMWLMEHKADVLDSMHADPEFFDAKIAGWWVWGVCSWIASGWCAGNGPWRVVDGQPVKVQPGQGVNRQRPHLGAGQGVNRQLPHGLIGYFEDLAAALRGVRVCCGDWSRVVTNGALTHGATVGVFLDPPYLGEIRAPGVYAVDDHTIAHDVRDWCLANGDNPRYRIVLAGYSPEHDHLIPDAWRRIRWSASSSYSTAAAALRQDGNHENRHLETLWCSPHCLDPANAAPTLFEDAS